MEIASKLESLPTELKLAIFDQLPDISTLLALVRASSAFHNVYYADRERILTRVTLRQLATRTQTIRDGKPVDIWEFWLSDERYAHPYLKGELQSAITSSCAQAHAGKLHEMRLTVRQCWALGSVAWVEGWKADENGLPQCYDENDCYPNLYVNESGTNIVVVLGSAGTWPNTWSTTSPLLKWCFDWSEELERILDT